MVLKRMGVHRIEAVLLFVTMLCFLWCVNQYIVKNEAVKSNSPFPGEISNPGVYWDGEMYDWNKVAVPPDPPRWESVGMLLGTTTEIPDTSLIMYADFNATGEIFRLAQYPGVLYGQITTDFAPTQWVRFATPKMARPLFYVNGRIYFGLRSTDREKSLPSEYRPVGTLLLCNEDEIPGVELTTNWNSFFNARVWVDDSNADMIYIETIQEWEHGEYSIFTPAWLCKKM